MTAKSGSDEMTWDNRVIKKTGAKGSEFYEVHEVFYDDEGKVIMYTEEPVSPFGLTVRELEEDYERIGEAFKAPVLEQADLPKDHLPLTDEEIEEADRKDKEAGL